MSRSSRVLGQWHRACLGPVDGLRPASLVLALLLSIQQAKFLTGCQAERRPMLLEAGLMNSRSMRKGNCLAQSCLQAPDSGGLR